MNSMIFDRTALQSLVCAFAVLCMPPVGRGQDTLKSGPQTGESLPGNFNALNINGRWAGKTVSLIQLLRGYAEPNPPRPFAVLFVRSADERTVQLIKKLDDEMVHSKKLRVGVVYLSDDPKINASLEKLVEKQKIREAVISTYPYGGSEGPEKWRISKEADVTVIFSYDRFKVQANFAFRKGELGEKQVEKIMNTAKNVKSKE
jgi:hypothetical protein